MIHGFLLVGALASIVTALGSVVYVLGNPQDYSLYFRAKYIAHLEIVRLHGVSAALTLLLGPLQLWKPGGRFHRPIGKAYLLSVALAGPTGLYLGTIAEGGPVSQAGYVVMALLWCFTGTKAWLSAKAKNFSEHRMWVVRNFSLASGAIALRLYLQVAEWTGTLFEDLYTSAVWVCWVPCLLLAEWYLSANSLNEG